MKRIRKAGSGFLAAWVVLGAASAGMAAIPQDKPFAMRGVELGITIDQFREIAVPLDEPRYHDPEVYCSDIEVFPRSIPFVPDLQAKADGIIECKWFSYSDGKTLWQHWISIGTGKGQPTFQFIEQGGQLRLFWVKFYANGQYYPGILDALTRGYGAPRDVVEPFKTTGGGDFTAMTSTWTNPFSRIELVQRCGHLERYCLYYEHTELMKLYSAILERRAASAAEKI